MSYGIAHSYTDLQGTIVSERYIAYDGFVCLGYGFRLRNYK